MNAAMEAIDLTTYNGEDPCLIHEPACQNCRAKLSEKQLAQCSTCSVVWYCSEECIETDSERHRMTCRNIARSKADMNIRAQELREQHGIEDPCLPRKSIPKAAREAHERFQSQVQVLAFELCLLADQVDTQELWETVLEFSNKACKMSDSSSRTRFEAGTAFILIRLGRLDDAWHFIRKFMVKQSRKGDCKKKSKGWYHAWRRKKTFWDWVHSLLESNEDTQGCYGDCVSWVRSCYPIGGRKLMRKEFDHLTMALLIIKLRVRVPAARHAWRDTVNNVFLNTDAGQELVPASFALAEMFSVSDDVKHMEQIQELTVVIHSLNPSLIPKFLNGSRVPYVRKLGLMRTPEGPEFLSSELESERFLRACEHDSLAAIQREADDDPFPTITRTAFLRYLLFGPTTIIVAAHLFLHWLSYTWVGYLFAFANAVGFCAALSPFFHRSAVDTMPKALNAVFFLACDIIYVIIMAGLFSVSFVGRLQVVWWRCLPFVVSAFDRQKFATDEGPEIWNAVVNLSQAIFLDNLYLMSLGWLFLSLGRTAMVLASIVLALFGIGYLFCWCCCLAWIGPDLVD